MANIKKIVPKEMCPFTSVFYVVACEISKEEGHGNLFLDASFPQPSVRCCSSVQLLFADGGGLGGGGVLRNGL